MQRAVGYLLLFLILSSCNKKRDYKVTYYPDGTIQTIKHYDLHDSLEGESVWFYPNGSVQEKVIFKNGKANGHAHYFYESGALKSHRFWKDDKMTGYVSDYFDDTLAPIKTVMLFNDSGQLVYKKTFDRLGTMLTEEGAKPK